MVFRILPSKSLLSSTLTSTSRGTTPTRCALPSWLVGRAIPFSFCGFHLIFSDLQPGAARERDTENQQIRKPVFRRRSQTSTVKHSRPNPNHLNGSRSSKNGRCAFTHVSPRRAMRFRRQRKKPLSGTPAA